MKDLHFKIDASNVSKEIMDFGKHGKLMMSDCDITLLTTLIKAGMIVLYPNLNIAEAKKLDLDTDHLISVFCGNYKKSYIYWSSTLLRAEA